MAWLPPDPPDAPAWQPPDPPDEAPPSMLERAGGMAMSALFPHRILADAVGQQIERGGQAVMDLPRQLGEQLDVTGTHYRNLGRLAGLPLDAPTPEAQGAYQQQVTDAGLTVGGGLAGRLIGKGVSEALKRAGRGFRTRAGAERMMAREADHLVTGKPTASIASELSAPAVTGTGTAVVVDALDPTPWEFTDKPVAGGAGVAAAALAHREAMENMLLGNPRWRALMMRGGAGGPLPAAAGAVIGYLLSKGIEISAESIDDVLDFVAGEERGEAVMGPIGGAAVPVEQDALARALLGSR